MSSHRKGRLRSPGRKGTRRGNNDGVAGEDDDNGVIEPQDEAGDRHDDPGTPDRSGAGYSVGYGKPPPDTQFKKGKSGNPAGRPKRSKNIRTQVREALTEPVDVRSRRGARKHPAIVAALKVHLQNALQGDLASLKVILPLLPFLDDGGAATAPSDVLAGRNVDEMLRRYLASRPDLLPSQPGDEGGDK